MPSPFLTQWFLAKTVKIGNFLHGSRVLSDGAPEEIRTPDPQIRSLVLYPAELRALDSTAGNRPAERGIAIVLTGYWQELRRELSRGLHGPGQGHIFNADSICEQRRVRG